MTDDDPDITANYHGGNAESAAAHRSLSRAQKRKARLTILRHLRDSQDGATCDEVELALGMSHQTASARCSELLRDGMVFDSGRRRPTRSGRSARVLVYALVGRDPVTV